MNRADFRPATFRERKIKIIEKIALFSYTKSLMAGGIALLAVICAGLWFRNRTIALNELLQTTYNLETQITDGQVYSGLIADYAKRLAALRADTKKTTGRFVGQDYYESPTLVRAIVKAASQAGMKMTGTSKQDKKTKVPAAKGKGPAIDELSYAITLNGSYPALVKFFQNLAVWSIGHKIDSIDVTPAEEGKAPGPAEARSDEVEVSLVLSVFMLEK